MAPAHRPDVVGDVPGQRSAGVPIAAAGLGILLLCLRLSVWPHPWPVHPDESEFVAALGFPQPYPVHHPGYPLWVLLGTLARCAGLSDYAAFAGWSIAASCVAPALLYSWLRLECDGRLAWLAGLWMGVQPTWWFLGVTAWNYSMAGLVATGVAGLCWSSLRSGRTGLALVGAVLLSASAGLRPDLLAWLGPLVVWTAWRGARRAGVIAAALLLAGAATWAGVTAWLYRGVGGPSLAHTLSVVHSTSVLSRGIVDGVARNAVKLLAYLGWSFGAGGALLVAVVLSRRRVAPARPSEAWFFLLWLGPVAAFQLLVHITEIGHAVWYLPPACAALALTLCRRVGRRTAGVLLSLAIAASVAQFWFYPWQSGVSGWRRVVNAKVAFASAAGLRRIHERDAMHRPGDFWTPRSTTGG